MKHGNFPTARLKQAVDPSRPITYGIVQCGPDVSPNGIPYVRPVDMTDEGGVDVGGLRHTSPEIAAPYRRSVVRAGDLVVSIGPSFGKVMVVPEAIDGGNLTQGTARVAAGPRMAPRFLFWALRSKPVAHAWDASCNGATFRALTLWGLGEAPVPMPPLPTQRAIADFLDRKTAAIDALIEKKQKLLDLLAEKRAALINQAVTKGLDPNVPMKDSGIPWIGEIPAHWEVKRLALLTRLIQTGPFGSQLHAEAYIEGGVPVVNPTNLVPPRIEPDTRKTVDDATAQRLSRHCLETGDLVFARRGALGRCGLVSRDEAGWLCGTGSLIVRLDTDRVIPEFVAWLAQTTWVAEWLSLQSVGSTMDNLNTQILGRLPLPTPPKAEQVQIVRGLVSLLTRQDGAIGNLTNSIDRLVEYRQALITAAVTGELDLEVDE